MGKHNIEVEGLPEGWEPVAIRFPDDGDYVLFKGVIEKKLQAKERLKD